jgi:hypothetical protein
MAKTDSEQPTQSASPAYEPRDVNWRPVFWVSAATIATIAALIAALTTMYASFTQGTTAASPYGPAVELESAHQLQHLRRQENERLSNYGWISRKERVVHIPIDRAIDLIVEEHARP